MEMSQKQYPQGSFKVSYPTMRIVITNNLVSHIDINRMLDFYDDPSPYPSQKVFEIYLHWNMGNILFNFNLSNAVMMRVKISYNYACSRGIRRERFFGKQIKIAITITMSINAFVSQRWMYVLHI